MSSKKRNKRGHYLRAKRGYKKLSAALGHLVACAVIEGDKDRENSAILLIVQCGREVRSIIREYERRHPRDRTH